MPKSIPHDSRILPSDFLPDFLQIDLGVGAENKNPLYRVLDDALLEIGELNRLEAFMLYPEYAPAAQKRIWLGGLGLCLGTLSDEAVHALFTQRIPLFEKRFSLAAIEILAKVYFGSNLVGLRRGRAETASRLSGRITKPLTVGAGPKETGKTITLFFGCTPDKSQWQEFRDNAPWFLAEGYVLHKAIAKSKLPLRQTLRLEPFALSALMLPAFSLNVSERSH